MTDAQVSLFHVPELAMKPAPVSPNEASPPNILERWMETFILPSLPNRLEILLVEDNPDDVFLLGEAFKKAKVASRLHAVPDGIEALAYLNGDGSYRERNAHPFPDMMLLDLNMPRMNGFEVLSRVRKNDQYGHMVVHVLTTSCRDEDVCRAYKMHANSYVVKPPRIDDMVRLADVLHKWHGFVSLPDASA